MRLANRFFVLFIKFYKSAISPFFPPTCRFTPTCSTYSMQAFSKYPFFKALWLSIRRVSRCHPFSPGGYDPLPDQDNKNTPNTEVNSGQ